MIVTKHHRSNRKIGILRYFVKINAALFFPLIVYTFTVAPCIPVKTFAQSRYMGEAQFEGSMDRYLQGDYEAAARGFRNFLKTAPNDFNGHYLLADCLKHLGDRDGALEYYEKALAINSDNVDARVYAGRLHQEKKDFAGAGEHYRKGLEILPHDGELLVLMATVRYDVKDYNGALEYCGQALTLHPERSDVYRTLGMVRRETGDRKAAFDSLQKALALDSEDAETYRQLALTYLKFGDQDNAVANLAKTIEIDSTNVQAHVDLGCILLNKGEKTQAAEHFSKALELYPGLREASDGLRKAAR